MIFILILVYVCNFQDNCPCNCFVVAYAQKPSKKPQKTLAKIFDKNPIKIWWDKNFYIFLNIQTKTKQ